MAQLAGRRWRTARRAGESHREAGSKGGAARCWAPPRSIQTRREAAGRWLVGDGTQAELAAEYGVSRSTMRRWCAAAEEGE